MKWFLAAMCVFFAINGVAAASAGRLGWGLALLGFAVSFAIYAAERGAKR